LTSESSTAPPCPRCGIVERDKKQDGDDSAVERGVTDKPPDRDAVVDFTIAKKVEL
jgi:hypothetical protein